MSSSKIYGDVIVAQPTNALYGDGSLSVYQDFKFTNTGVHELNNGTDTTGQIYINSAGSCLSQAGNGDNTLGTAATNANGDVLIQASGTGTSNLNLYGYGSGGITMSSHHASASLNINSGQNLVTNSVGTSLHTAAGNSTVQSTAGDVFVLASDGTKNVTCTAGLTSGIASMNAYSVQSVGINDVGITTVDPAGVVTVTGGLTSGNVTIDSKTLNIGNTTADTINLGRSSANVAIAGNLTVAGTTTTVNSTDLLVQDNVIVANAAPSVAGKDGAFMFHRYKDDVAADASFTQTTLQANASSGLSSFTVAIDDVDYIGAVVELSEGGNTERFEITSTTRGGSTQILTVDSALANAYTSASCVVKLWTRSKAAMFYNETDNEFALVETNTKHDDANIREKNYSTLHVGKLIIGDGVNPSASADVEVDIVANSAVAVAIPQSGTRGSYQVTVSGSNDNQATATFFISKAQISSTPSTFRLTSSASTFGEELTLEWNASETLKLKHDSVRVSGTVGETVTYKVSLKTNV